MSVNGSNNFLNIEDANLRVRNGSVHAQGMTIGGAIVSASHGLQSVSDTGNTTSNTLQFTNATTAFKATSNIELTANTAIVVESNVLMDFKTLGQIEFPGSTVEQEYPPGPMDGYETLIPGHGVFFASMSNPHTSGRDAWKAFNKATGNTDYIEHAYTPSYQYGANDGNTLNSYANPANIPYKTNGVVGLWIQLELPYEINLKRYSLTARSTSLLQASRMPEQGIIFGSNDGEVWTAIHNHNDTAGRYTSGIGPRYFSVDDTYTYRYFRLVTTKLFQLASTSGNERPDISELKFFGTPGPTTLDKGSLTLGRSLDVPRVSRYDVDTETPRPEKLLVDFDTTVNSSPTDISGQGNHGAFYGTNMNYSSADKAFVFNGTDDYIETSIDIGSGGNILLCFSTWVKYNADGWWFWLGDETTPGGIGAESRSSGTRIRFVVRSGNYVEINSPGYNTWNHYTFIHTGSTTSDGRMDIYMNGVFIEPVDSRFNYATTNITNNNLRIGDRGSSPNIDGQISNFKIYSVALEPSEVQKLYRLGRTGRSMVISDTAVGIGKVPEAQLDVRGSFRAPGMIVQVESSTMIETWSSTLSTTFQEIDGMSVTIHPKFKNSKFLVSYQANIGSNGHVALRLRRKQGGVDTFIAQPTSGQSRMKGTAYCHARSSNAYGYSLEHLDDPGNDTSPITYHLVAYAGYGTSYYILLNKSYNDTNNAYYGRASSTITVKEICQ